MEILKCYDTEVIKVSDNVNLFYLEDEISCIFYICVDNIPQMVSKNFYIEIQEKYFASKGRAYKVLTDDGNYDYIWELDS